MKTKLVEDFEKAANVAAEEAKPIFEKIDELLGQVEDIAEKHGTIIVWHMNGIDFPYYSKSYRKLEKKMIKKYDSEDEEISNEAESFFETVSELFNLPYHDSISGWKQYWMGSSFYC